MASQGPEPSPRGVDVWFLEVSIWMTPLYDYIVQLLHDAGVSHRANVVHSQSREQETVVVTPTTADACKFLVWRDDSVDTNVIEIDNFSVELYGPPSVLQNAVRAVIDGSMLIETRTRNGRTVAVRATWPRSDGSTYSYVDNVSLRFWGHAETSKRHCHPF